MHLHVCFFKEILICVMYLNTEAQREREEMHRARQIGKTVEMTDVESACFQELKWDIVKTGPLV